MRGVVDQVAMAMSADAAVGDLLIEPPRLKRVDSVGDTGVTITISARTRPAARWQIESEFGQRLAEAFVSEKIHVPFPVYAPEAEKPAG